MLTKVEPLTANDHLVEVGPGQILVHLNPETPETVTERQDEDRLQVILWQLFPPAERAGVDYAWFCYDDHGWDVFVVRYCSDN